MNNKFIWSHGPISVELKELNGEATKIKNIETFELEDLKYKLAVHTEIDNRTFSKQISVTDYPQIIYVEDAIKRLSNIDYKKQGCLIDSDVVTTPPITGVITSFRERYLSTILLEDEALSGYSIKLERNDYNFKFSADEPVSSKTTYNISFGFPYPNFPDISDEVSIKGLTIDEISNFSKVISSFIHKTQNKIA